MPATELALATPADVSYLAHLSRKHADALGWIPTAALASYADRGRVTVARVNRQHAGYLLHSPLADRCRIFQACIQYDARRRQHGEDLVADLVARAAVAGSRIVTLHCRDGLDSNAFWSACGFELAELNLGGKARGKIINHWQLDVGQAIVNPTLPFAAAFLRHAGSSRR